jgi:hypothetical protein
MLSKAPGESTPADLDQLRENRVRESRTLEFKLDYGRADGKTRRLNDAEKKEFLADVSALANSGGGDLVIGIREESGEAVEVVGMDLEDPDAELNKLENILRDCLEPRLPNPSFGHVQLENGRQVFIIRAPRSWIGPHRVTMDQKFYARNSAGKYAMDVSELRQAFTLAEALVDRVRRFRHERLALISANEAMVPLMEGPKVVMQIVPLSAFASSTQIQFRQNEWVGPLGSPGSFNFRYALEGQGTYSGDEHSPDGCRSYSLLFRSGIIEGVGHVGNHFDQTDQFVYAADIEGPLAYDAPLMLQRLRKEEVEGPFYVFLSLLGVKGRSMHVGGHRALLHSPKPIRTDTLLFPEIVLPTAAIDDGAIRPICDMVFNAFGFSGSPSFDANGTYRRK